jgi:hypothetical protein
MLDLSEVRWDEDIQVLKTESEALSGNTKQTTLQDFLK